MQAENISLSDTFNSDDYVINIIRRAVTNSQNILIDGSGFGRITILVDDAEYFSDVEDMQSFCQLNSSAFKVTVFDNEKIQNYKTGIGRNLDELLWMAGYYASEGRIMEDCKWNDVLELIHWPNFTRLPMHPDFLRIASLLSQHATSIEYTIALLKISREQAYRFYSAAHVSGAVKIVNRDVDKELCLKPHRNNALLGLLLNKIIHI